ncbi:MAG: fluoride efflux transporter CrcB [Desulfurococcales archaeon]|nr:fluoride efflux transporter CrcB [Desulfurococcales archaeon]
MRVDLDGLLLVFTGGGLGALARWITSEWVQERVSGSLFPWGTLAVNVAGSFLLGFIMGAALLHGAFTRDERLFAATGFAGAFTTFSTFMYETLVLLGEVSPTLALANLAVSIIFGLTAAYVGYVVAGLVYG